MHPVLKKIDKKLAQLPTFSAITDYLTGSELNSLLMEVFRNRTQQVTPSELLNQFNQNRFVQPAAVNVLLMKKLELSCLQLA